MIRYIRHTFHCFQQLRTAVPSIPEIRLARHRTPDHRATRRTTLIIAPTTMTTNRAVVTGICTCCTTRAAAAAAATVRRSATARHAATAIGRIQLGLGALQRSRWRLAAGRLLMIIMRRLLLLLLMMMGRRLMLMVLLMVGERRRRRWLCGLQLQVVEVLMRRVLRVMMVADVDHRRRDGRNGRRGALRLVQLVVGESRIGVHQVDAAVQRRAGARARFGAAVQAARRVYAETVEVVSA